MIPENALAIQDLNPASDFSLRAEQEMKRFRHEIEELEISNIVPMAVRDEDLVKKALDPKTIV